MHCRLVHGLSISLLELNTFVHTLCAFATYGLWWDKPLNVQQPTFIVGDQMRGLCSYLYFRSKVGAIGVFGLTKPRLIVGYTR